MHINDVDMVTPPEPGHCPESIHEVKQMYTISFVLSMLLLGRGWRNIGHWAVFYEIGEYFNLEANLSLHVQRIYSVCLPCISC